MTSLIVTIGDLSFDARLETNLAPKTSSVFEKLLPYKNKVVHVRWSGEGVWVPLGETNFDVPYENHTSHPAPGHMILYPGGISETELLLAYGGVDFSSKMGQLAGSHFLTLTSNLEALPEVGRRCLWNGAQDIVIDFGGD